MDYFWSPNKGFMYGAKEKKRKKEIKLRYGIFVWIHDFCMDFWYAFCIQTTWV